MKRGLDISPIMLGKAVDPMAFDGLNPEDLEIFQRVLDKPRLAPRAGLSFRCPAEIKNANSLSITGSHNPCHHEGHNHVIVNGLELCPVSAILFLIAAKNFNIVSDRIMPAVKKILRCSKGDSV